MSNMIAISTWKCESLCGDLSPWCSLLTSDGVNLTKLLFDWRILLSSVCYVCNATMWTRSSDVYKRMLLRRRKFGKSLREHWTLIGKVHDSFTPARRQSDLFVSCLHVFLSAVNEPDNKLSW